YLSTPIPIQSYVFQPFCNSNQASTSVHETRSISMPSITIVVDEMVSKNAAAQKRALSIKKENAEKLVELQAAYEVVRDLQLKNDILHRILEVKQIIDEETKKFSVKQFAAMFSHYSVVISQDDKAKVPLGIPAVGKTFQTMQTINENVTLADHDFPIGAHQKLIPLVYLAIDPSDSNDSLRKGQLAIFIRPQYNVGTSSNTHMADLITLTNQESFKHIFENNGQIKPIWVLLVDGGPDENPRHLKNICRYSRLFQFLDLDYLTVRTHAPGQSAYNPVERAMSTLSGKLAGITLPIDTFGSHLDSQGKVINQELAKKNFRHAGETLCTLWSRDLIFGKNVMAQYVEDNLPPFQIEDNEEESKTFWKWLEKHTQICQYSLDIRKCDDLTCCHPKRNEESAAFLAENGGFLPP
ncbi:7100_t:CDS:2, partial [Gigaspora margarita]